MGEFFRNQIRWQAYLSQLSRR